MAPWRTHEFTGPKATSDGSFLGEPTTLQDDVFRLKESDLESGVRVPFDEAFIKRFRFHGCKATMVTYMQHFGDGRALSFRTGEEREYRDSASPWRKE